MERVSVARTRSSSAGSASAVAVGARVGCCAARAPTAAMDGCAELSVMASATFSHWPRRSARSCRDASARACAPSGRKPASCRTRAGRLKLLRKKTVLRATVALPSNGFRWGGRTAGLAADGGCPEGGVDAPGARRAPPHTGPGAFTGVGETDGPGVPPASPPGGEAGFYLAAACNKWQVHGETAPDEARRACSPRSPPPGTHGPERRPPPPLTGARRRNGVSAGGRP